METYCNRKTYSLRYTDYDARDRLSPYAVLSLAQESAAASADELGFGYADLKPRGYGFIVVNTYCEFRRPVPLGARVTMETWPLPPRHVIFERDSRLLDEEGNERVAIAARWCLVDLATFSLLQPEALGAAHENCPYRAEKTVEPPSWKIPKLEGGREVLRRTVHASDCDHYFHANNAKYAEMFLDCFTLKELARPVRAFQIAYAKQAKEGMELVFTRADGESTVCEARAEGELIAQFRIWFGEETA